MPTLSSLLSSSQPPSVVSEDEHFSKQLLNLEAQIVPPAAVKSPGRRAYIMLTTLMMLVSVSVCLLLWVSVKPAQAASASSTEAVVASKREFQAMAVSRISRALAAVNEFKLRFLLPSESSVPAFTEYMGNTGVLDWNSTALESNFSTMALWFSICFDVLQAHPGISRCEFTCYTSLNYSNGLDDSPPPPPSHLLDGKVTGVPQIVSYIRLNVDLLTSRRESTIYSMSLSLSNPQNTSVLTYNYLNQTSGSNFIAFYSLSVPTIAVALPSIPLEATWAANYSFDSYSGGPEIILSRRYPTTTMDAFYDLELHTSITNVSAYLASLTLNTKKDRFYIFFRTPEGVLLGASHGKYFSHSDVDLSGNNPFTNPPPVSQFQQYTPVSSTDATIRYSARWLLARHKRWDCIPEGEFAASLDSGRFWITSAIINSLMQLVYLTSA